MFVCIFVYIDVGMNAKSLLSPTPICWMKEISIRDHFNCSQHFFLIFVFIIFTKCNKEYKYYNYKYIKGIIYSVYKAIKIFNSRH